MRLYISGVLYIYRNILYSRFSFPKNLYPYTHVSFPYSNKQQTLLHAFPIVQMSRNFSFQVRHKTSKKTTYMCSISYIQFGGKTNRFGMLL